MLNANMLLFLKNPIFQKLFISLLSNVLINYIKIYILVLIHCFHKMVFLVLRILFFIFHFLTIKKDIPNLPIQQVTNHNLKDKLFFVNFLFYLF